MNRQITVIGSSNVDFIMQVEHLPAVGETVTDATFLQTYGGKGANTAVAAARARRADSAAVTFITGVGDDMFGQAMLDNFRQDGMNVEHAVVKSGTPSGSALVMFDRQGDNYLTVAPGANYALEPSTMDTCAEVIAQSDLIVMQMEIPVPTIQRALEIAQASGVRVLFNYAPVKTRDLPVTAAMTGLVVNEGEAAALTGLPVQTREQAERAAQELRRQGPEFVVLTLGADGALLVSEESVMLLPAFRVEPVDTTAAGDVFCGALAVALTEGKSLPEAARFASAASAISVTRMGAQPSVPHREEIEIFLRSASANASDSSMP